MGILSEKTAGLKPKRSLELKYTGNLHNLSYNCFR
jgi:hypothetical protein